MWQYRSKNPGSLFTHHHRLSCDLTARLLRRSSADGLSASLAPLKASVGKFLGCFAFWASGDCAYPGDAVVVDCYCVEGECLIAAVFAFVGADCSRRYFHADSLIHIAPRFNVLPRTWSLELFRSVLVCGKIVTPVTLLSGLLGFTCVGRIRTRIRHRLGCRSASELQRAPVLFRSGNCNRLT